MRTKNVLRNLFASWIGQICYVLIRFISRWIFLNTLSIEYLGINGLFTNVLTILSFADLGLSLSISYYLYEPLVANDEKKIAATVNCFRKIYHTVGIIVLIMGFLGIPFLKFIIKDCSIPEIKTIYCLYVINTSISYFNTHKSTLLTANQKQYIKTIYSNVAQMIQMIVGIVVLIYTHSYILYYLLEIAVTVIVNILVSAKADRIYPYLKKYRKEQDREQIKRIKDNMVAMIIHKLSSVVVNGTDNILISAFVSLASVGLYSNYSVIVVNVNNALLQFFKAMTASIGNYAAIENKESKTKLFYMLMFLNFWLYGFCTICLYVLIDPFIKLWIGEQYLLGREIVFIIILNFYLQGMRRTVLCFRDAEGLFRQDCYKAILEAVINLVVSLYLVKRIGLLGVFIGTAVSTFIACVWLEPYILFKNRLQGSIFRYYIRYFKYLLEVAFAGGLTYFACNRIGDTFFAFIIKIILCCLIPNGVFWLIYKRTPEFKELLDRVKNILKFKRI